MKLRWTERAAQDLETIQHHIADDSPRDADELVAGLIDRTEQIREFLRSGRAVPEYDDQTIREVVHES